MRKKLALLLGIIVLSIFLFVRPIRAHDIVDYDHRREYDNLSPNQSAVIWFSFLYTIKPFHWEFTTILDNMQINVTLATRHSDPYWIETWDLSSNRTHHSGAYTVPYSGINEGTYQIYFKNVGNITGYIMADIWIDRMPSSHIHAEWDYYRLPSERPESTWDCQSRDNYIEQYYGVETHFQADQYDYFLVAFKGSDYSRPAMFVDKSNYEKLVEDGFIYNSRITTVFFSSQIQTFRPTHNDTWYFVFVNAYSSEVYLNVSVRYTENYYEEPEPQPDPDSDPIGRNDNIIPFIVGFSVLGLILVVGVIGVMYRIRVRKSKLLKTS
ncbi:MAG: hypothetical protein KJI71_04085 [Patescibacteria group bacterium]|nr:hypothetical protein [Patescibacteria group bacterium]